MRDMYDYELEKAANLYAKYYYLCMNTRATPQNVAELGRRCQQDFWDAGFIVNVDFSSAAIINPETELPFEPVLIEIIGYVDDPSDKEETDHDRKRFEVRDAVANNEEYRGQKRKVNQPRKKS